MRKVWVILALFLCAAAVIGSSLQDSQSGFRNIAGILNPVGYEIRDAVTLETTTVDQQTVDFITLEDNEVYHVTAIVKAIEDGANRASYNIEATVYRDGGGATVQGGVTSLHTAESEAAWDATFTVSSNDLHVSVTGEAGTTISWTCTLIHSNGGL